MPGPTAAELRKTVTNRLIEALEKGTRPWIKPWVGDPNAGYPTNIASKRRYRGVNPWLLNLTSISFGYESKWWGTYKQWKEKGGVVRRGEKGTMIVFWSILERKETDKDTGEKKKGRYFYLKYSKVFNLEQVDNIEGKNTLDKYRIDSTVLPTFDHEEYEPAEEVIRNSGAKISYGGSNAFYKRSTDEIKCPPKNRFPKLNEFYSAIFHELTHWAEIRTGFDEVEDKSYALGELVAEMGACYICEELGVPIENPADNDKQSAAYLRSWLKALKNDTKFIFVASKWASKAADLLLGEEINEIEPSNGNDEIVEKAA